MIGRLDRFGRGGAGALGCLLDEDVGVGSGEPERADSRDTGTVGAFPGHGLVHDPHRDAVPRNVRRRVAEVQVLGQFAVLEGQDHLEHTGHPGGGFQMADVRLRRADQQRPVGRASPSERGCRGLDLDGITQRRTGPVRLEIVHICGGQSGAVQRLGDDPLLGDAVGHRQATRCAVGVHRAAADHRTDPVAVADRVLQPLDGDDTAALAAHVAVGRGVEGLAAAIGCEHPGLREGDHGGRTEQNIRSAGQGEVTLTQAQRLAGLMDRHQRRTARGVDGDRRAVQSQPVADPAGAGGTGRADRHIGLDLVVGKGIGCHAQVVVGRQTDEDAGTGVRQSRWRGARMLHGPPCRLQQQSMLRVDPGGLARRDSEERRIEPADVVDEPGAPGDDLAGRGRIRVEEFIDIPAVRRHL